MTELKDYKTLVNQLREHHCDAKEDDTQEVCEECAYNIWVDGFVCVCGQMHRAADAIDTLLKTLCEWCAVCPIDERNPYNCEIIGTEET